MLRMEEIPDYVPGLWDDELFELDRLINNDRGVSLSPTDSHILLPLFI